MSKKKQVDGEASPANGEQKPVESKADKFRRLASRRVGRAIKTLRHVANLGNRAQYEYTEEQVDRIIGALRVAALKVTSAFEGKKDSEESFQL